MMTEDGDRRWTTYGDDGVGSWQPMKTMVVVDLVTSKNKEGLHCLNIGC